ncbi:MAG: MFS transporter [Lachnospiraceae bacterium]|nr:MFS transporter [Lachnospiraceae bacterium]
MIPVLLIIIYLSFISLGLPDALLGSAWPVMYQELVVPLSYSGIIFMITAVGTVISSLCSDRLIRRWGTGWVTFVSVLMTAMAMLGFSITHSFVLLCLWAIPYGLGAGSVDAALNNYVALHYESRHMSWLHCMWGIGASIGPYIMGMVLANGKTWNTGYRTISLMQFVLALILCLSLSLWNREKMEQQPGKGRCEDSDSQVSQKAEDRPLTIAGILRLSGAKETMICFFCYCALEQTTGLWASSYLVMERSVPEITAAKFASLFFVGITLGRAVSGFITFRLKDDQMVRLGECIILFGIACVLLPVGGGISLAGFVLIGLGCAPIYPSMLHATPDHFGKEQSQAVIGIQMASAYIGTSVMPPLFGLLTRWLGTGILPVYLGGILAVMMVMHGRISRKKTGGADVL